MALREVRIYISTGDRKLDNEISEEIYHPFTFYMDALMRGRFKEYSGEEVKGLSLVNLRLYTQELIKDAEERGLGGCIIFDKWVPALNTLQMESRIDLKEFKGNQIEKISKAIDIFLAHAEKSDLPQMRKLVEHLKESPQKQSIKDAIDKANEYLEKLNAN